MCCIVFGDPWSRGFLCTQRGFNPEFLIIVTNVDKSCIAHNGIAGQKNRMQSGDCQIARKIDNDKLFEIGFKLWFIEIGKAVSRI
jgi:hypothetical protein